MYFFAAATDGPPWLTIVIGLSTIVLGFLTFYRGSKNDQNAAEAQHAAASAENTAIAFGGYKELLGILQATSRQQAEALKECVEKCEFCEQRAREQDHKIEELTLIHEKLTQDLKEARAEIRLLRGHTDG